MTAIGPNHRKILICDDEIAVIEAYRRILSDLVSREAPQGEGDLDTLAEELFGDGASSQFDSAVISEIVYCRQGADAVAAFEQAKDEGQPFAAVFLDVRMPPGIDGVEAARRIRALDPAINIVMVTGYSDHRPAEIASIVGAQDRLFYLVKPFDPDEVRQLLTTLANRWLSDMRMANELVARLKELEAANLALQASEASAQHAARRDSLTGLLNRYGLAEEFTTAANRAAAAGLRMALAYIDLDRFKLVNDVHGHAIGDRFICEVAKRIVEAVQDNGFVARIGGDEFAVVCLDEGRLDDVLTSLSHVGQTPYVEAGIQLPVSLSVGYSVSAACCTDLSEAMRQADLALYAAKAAGRGMARAYDRDLDEEFLRTQGLSRDLKEAIEGNDLLLHYQPLMSADGRRVTGVEALLRWSHPVHGPISPSIFVPIAEQNNLMCQLGDWVLQQAFQDMRLWPDLVTSVNLSSLQFARPDFAQRVIELARQEDVRPTMVEFEITETALAGDIAKFSEQVEKLVAAGFGLALDDFGSGYAGIGYLTRLSFSKLKIDRPFIGELNIQPNAERTIRSIIGLGEAMGLTVTAEGVEEEFQHHLLREAGCDQMQGFLFHKPCSREDVQRLLRRQRHEERAA
jgi:diguanylate cyclase (GGDEF)-like protein